MGRQACSTAVSELVLLLQKKSKVFTVGAFAFFTSV
jgi:hypothetical protein